MPEVVFVHGALVRDGAWWWGPTGRLLLAETGARTRAVPLPSCGEGVSASTAGIEADAVALRAVLDEVGDAVVVGHSYGGTVIAEAGRHPAVRHLLLISSYLPEAGSSQAAIMGDETDPVRIAPNDDGTLSVDGYDVHSFGERFLQDAPADVQQQAWKRVTAQAAGAFVTPVSQAGWQGVDSTFLVCTEDRSTSVGLQRRHAARATRSVDVPTGHHPFITRPDLVVDALRPLLAA